MNVPAFVNRTKEAQKISTDIGISSNSSNRVIFIAGKIGVGKSCLIEKIIKNDVTGFRTIHLDICKNIAQTIRAGSYIDFFMNSIDKLAKNHT